MFIFLFNFLKTCILSVLFNDYLKRVYPEKYNDSIVTLSYNLIKFYSKAQIFYGKLVVYVNNFIEANPNLKQILNDFYKKEIERNTITQVKGTDIHIKYYTDFNETYFDTDEDSIYIFSDNINAVEKPVNNVILHSQPFSSVYQVSNVKFMLVELLVNEKSYKIDLKTDKYNYYIVDNILDNRFFKYFLNNYHASNIDDNTLTLKIVDQNVDSIEIDLTNKYIQIKQDSYIIGENIISEYTIIEEDRNE